MNKTLLTKYVELIVVIMFVLSSGTVGIVCFIPQSVVSVLFLLVSSCVLFVHKKIKYPSETYVALLVYMFLDCYFIHMGGNKEHTAITYSFFFVGTTVIVGTFDFFRFRDLLTKVLYYITIVGLLVWVLSELGILHCFVVNKGDWQYRMIGPYCLGWHNLFHRYAGIWHEPGACMIFMNIIVLLHFRELCTWKWRDAKQARMVLIFVLAIICTQSTTGYLTFALMSAVWVLRFKLSNKRLGVLVKIFVVVIGAVALMYLCTSDVVINKLTASTDGPVQTSKGMRLVENMTLFDIFTSNPVFGAGLGSNYQWNILIKNGAIGCSNGLLYFLSGLGLVWFIPFLYLLVKSIKNLKDVAPLWLILIVFILLEVNEQYMLLPITLMFFLPFMTYEKPKYLYSERKFGK